MSYPTATAFAAAFCGRTKRYREHLGFTQAQMAAALRIPLERYRKYETRSPLPHYLVPSFCLLCRIELEDLYGVQSVPTRPRPRSERILQPA